jgi:hypothetical protein
VNNSQKFRSSGYYPSAISLERGPFEINLAVYTIDEHPAPMPIAQLLRVPTLQQPRHLIGTIFDHHLSICCPLFSLKKKEKEHQAYLDRSDD